MKKKVLIVTDFYEPHKSGIVTYINQLLNILEKNFFDITILTTKTNKYEKNDENFNKIKIIRADPTFTISRGFYSFKLLFKFLQIRNKFDIININLPLVEIFPLVFFIKKKQTIITYHCLPHFNILGFLIKFYFYLFGILSIFNSKKVIVLSKEYFNNIFFHKYIKKNLIEIPPYALMHKIKNINSNKNHILKIGFLGRLSYEKGLHLLINASFKLQKKNLDHKVYIAGNINDKRFTKYIKYIFKISKGNKNIKFINNVNEKEKKEFFEEIDIFVLPSTNSLEAFGIVQLEAMSYGVPVISSNIKGVNSVINKTNNGYSFMNNNEDDLVKKILLLSKRKIDKLEIKKNVNYYYSESNFKNKILDLF